MMTNDNMFLRYYIAKNIPLTMEGRELTPATQASVVIMRVGYERGVNAFEDEIRKVANELKAEKFDERYAAYNEQKQKDAEYKDEAFEAELSELNAKVLEVRKKRATEPSDAKERLLTEAELADIIAVIKTEGNMKVNFGTKEDEGMPREQFVGMVAAYLVES